MSTICIIEDEGSLRKVLRTKFEGNGYEVIEAKDGVEALEILQDKIPDIILLDVVMPRMDGLTFLKEWGKQKRDHDIPVIILSNLTDGEKIQYSLESGVYDYLVKADWSLEDVLSRVKERLKK